MHQYYEVNPGGKIYRNDDEVDYRNSQYDYTLVLPESRLVLEVGSVEAAVWKGLASRKLVSEIVADITLITGKFEQQRVDQIISSWLVLGLVKPPLSAWHPIKKSWLQRFVWAEMPIRGLSRLFKSLYARFGKYLFTEWGAASVFGLYLAAALVAVQMYFQEITVPVEVGTTSLPVLLTLMLTSLALHETGHAMAMVWSRAEILRTGVALYFGIPMLFVDTSTIWSRRRMHRLITASAGMMVNGIIISLSVIAAFVVQNPQIETLLWELAFINLIHVGFSLLPFIKMDGYYILIDLIGIPNLQQRAYVEMQQIMHHPKEFDFSRKQGLLLAYGSLSLVGSLAMMAYAVHYWASLLGIVN